MVFVSKLKSNYCNMTAKTMLLRVPQGTKNLLKTSEVCLYTDLELNFFLQIRFLVDALKPQYGRIYEAVQSFDLKPIF